MDRRLFQAAWTGNVEELFKLKENDPFILHKAAIAGGETPLHIACLAGHLDFVKEVIKLRKEFGMELNQDGFSPLHIASANGHMEIVKELLKIDHNLCLLKGRDGRIPLHYAAIKGKVDVLRELLSAKADSIAEMTARGETALHLAVKNNQFEAFKALVEHLRQSNKEDVLNRKDDQGNTILHHAVSRKQYEVIKLLLDEDVITRGLLDVNSSNDQGLTPLDVLLFFQSEAGDIEIESYLKGAGASRAEELRSLEQTTVNNVNEAAVNNTPNDQPSRSESRPRSPADRLWYYFRYDNYKDSPTRVRDSLLVIAILIATATYQAVLSPPGGVWQDDCQPGNGNNCTSSAPAHIAGQSVMGTHNPTSYCIFLVSNSIGFFISVHMIYFLTNGFPMQLELRISMLALVVTYDTCMVAIAPGSSISTLFSVMSGVLPTFVPVAIRILRNYLKTPECQLPLNRNQASV